MIVSNEIYTSLDGIYWDEVIEETRLPIHTTGQHSLIYANDKFYIVGTSNRSRLHSRIILASTSDNGKNWRQEMIQDTESIINNVSVLFLNQQFIISTACDYNATYKTYVYRPDIDVASK